MGKVHLLNCKCTADLRLPQLNQSQIQKQIQIQMKIYNKYKKNSNNILQTANVQSTCLRGTAHSVSRTNILQPLLVTCHNHLHYCHHHYHNPHIGHICRVFLRCELSSVSSICLPKQMRSHIDYMCAVFLQSEFSNVFSNRLP